MSTDAWTSHAAMRVESERAARRDAQRPQLHLRAAVAAPADARPYAPVAASADRIVPSLLTTREVGAQEDRP